MYFSTLAVNNNSEGRSFLGRCIKEKEKETSVILNHDYVKESDMGFFFFAWVVCFSFKMSCLEVQVLNWRIFIYNLQLSQISPSWLCSFLLIIFGVSLFSFIAAFLYAVWVFEPHCSLSSFYYHKIQNTRQGKGLQRLQHNHTSPISKWEEPVRWAILTNMKQDFDTVMHWHHSRLIFFFFFSSFFLSFNFILDSKRRIS